MGYVLSQKSMPVSPTPIATVLRDYYTVGVASTGATARVDDRFQQWVTRTDPPIPLGPGAVVTLDPAARGLLRAQVYWAVVSLLLRDRSKRFKTSNPGRRQACSPSWSVRGTRRWSTSSATGFSLSFPTAWPDGQLRGPPASDEDRLSGLCVGAVGARRQRPPRTRRPRGDRAVPSELAAAAPPAACRPTVPPLPPARSAGPAATVSGPAAAGSTQVRWTSSLTCAALWPLPTVSMPTCSASTATPRAPAGRTGWWLSICRRGR